ncbi:MAG TPA: nitronate monooxygenase [Actinocrinis sp.]|uniref:nitronate monooxygenase n=1 Tax=Actinocrinis sp. TaxID=1920516 RepID=UPI002D296655|nr:nitronate monooxygenase [Actinocrinis sp.]HZU58509.1 nitronate monooxygenase [Actinocrinis sp.]
MSTRNAAGPKIIQGGMGVAVSGWPLARAVSMTGQLGVVSGTALEVVCARRLQRGDPGGHVRRALAHFPLPQAAQRIVGAYYRPADAGHDGGFRPTPRFTLRPGRALQELTIAANFVEVFLAKEGHDGIVGINYLRKIEMPLPFACYGALLAGVDHVLVGAGNPAELPGLLDRLAAGEPASLSVRVQGATTQDGEFAARFDPRDLFGPSPPVLRRPRLDAIVASVDLAAALAANPVTRPDGFVVEGYRAGGHNAPPRGPRRFDESGQPLYDERDEVAPDALHALGVPYWMAGSYGTPNALAAALAAGASGVQVGTLFALCQESGMAPHCKQRLLALAAEGRERVRTDDRVSPTGFPFKVADLPGTLSDEQTYQQRPRLCDLGVLRSAYRKPDGSVGYRCPSEPVAIYTERHGGRSANAAARRCLCNALLATAGLAQQRPDGYTEPPIVTSGTDYTGVRALLSQAPDGQTYTARDAVAYLLGNKRQVAVTPKP